MAQTDQEWLREALALEEHLRDFLAQARRATGDELLAATFQFLETQHTLALHQLADEVHRLKLPEGGPLGPEPAPPSSPPAP